MMLQNPNTKGYIDYPINLNLHKHTFQIVHETCFCAYNVPWQVTILDSGDMVYIPCGYNRSHNIYIVTRFYINKQVSYPHGIYTVPLSNFTTNRRYDNVY